MSSAALKITEFDQFRPSLWGFADVKSVWLALLSSRTQFIGRNLEPTPGAGQTSSLSTPCGCLCLVMCSEYVSDLILPQDPGTGDLTGPYRPSDLHHAQQHVLRPCLAAGMQRQRCAWCSAWQMEAAKAQQFTLSACIEAPTLSSPLGCRWQWHQSLDIFPSSLPCRLWTVCSGRAKMWPTQAAQLGQEGCCQSHKPQIVQTLPRKHTAQVRKTSASVGGSPHPQQSRRGP